MASAEEDVERIEVVVWTVEDVVGVVFSSLEVDENIFGSDLTELEDASTVVTAADEDTVTATAPPPPVCVLEAVSDAGEVDSITVDVGSVELEAAWMVFIAADEDTATVKAPTPPLCALEVTSVASACAEAELSLACTVTTAVDDGSMAVIIPPFFVYVSEVALDSSAADAELAPAWTVTTAVDDGTVTVMTPPPPVCAFEVALDSSAGEVELELLWTVIVDVDDGIVTVTIPPLWTAAVLEVAFSLAVGAELLPGTYALAVALIEAELVVVSSGWADGAEAPRDGAVEAAWYTTSEEVACSAAVA